MDYLTVPGTIAAFYSDATAAFVLSSGLTYLIDPRTPLFQDHIEQPKASHYALSEWLGPSARVAMGDSSSRSPVTFTSEFYTDDVLRELVEGVVGAQHEYGQRARTIQDRLQRYTALLTLALPAGKTGGPSVVEETGPSPSFILAPYFAFSGFQDPWWSRNQEIWRICDERGTKEVSAVVAPTTPLLLNDALDEIPQGMSGTTFYWITGFDERNASESQLSSVMEAIRSQGEQRDLINLYGGFFSIALQYVNLWGINSGLGYSEARSWPDLPTTGAAPPRYYVPRIHAFMSPAAAQLLIDFEPSLACECPVCLASGRPIVRLDYGELKRHFAQARDWERKLVSDENPEALATMLIQDAQMVEVAARQLPTRLVPDVGFLRRWASVLTQGL